MEVPKQVVVYEQPGTISSLKLSEVVKKILEYGMNHPEICTDQKQKEETE